jgi:hypothetical protein
MSAEIVNFPKKDGNGAREALIDATRVLPGRKPSDADFLSDWILGELWERGFKVVPLDGTEE